MSQFQMPPILVEQDELNAIVRAKLIASGCPNNLKTAREAEIVVRNLRILATNSK